jgi:hypothetical protein
MNEIEQLPKSRKEYLSIDVVQIHEEDELSFTDLIDDNFFDEKILNKTEQKFIKKFYKNFCR